MDNTYLIPVADAIPVHWLWLQSLLTATTFLHFIAMNILLGSGIIALVAALSAGETDGPLSRAVAASMPYSMALTINFGVAPLLFVQTLYGPFFYTSSILMAVPWFAVFGLLILAYCGIYLHGERHAAGSPALIFLIVSLLIMAIVAFIFSNNVSLMQLPGGWNEYFSRGSGWLLNLADRMLLPRYLHMVVSSVAVGGLAIAAWFEFMKRRGKPGGEVWIGLGVKWFAGATVINFGIGFWLLGSIPAGVPDNSTLVGKLFSLMLIATVATTAMSLIRAVSGRVVPAVCWTLSTVLLMTVARDCLRLELLRPWLEPGKLSVTGQYLPLIIFLGLFVGAACLTVWLLRMAVDPGEVKS